MELIPNGKGLEEYGDHELTEFQDTPIPFFLKVTYVVVTLLGLIGMIYFWGGSRGYFDRGYWRELQIVAGTTRDVAGTERPRMVEVNDRNSEEVAEAPSWWGSQR